MNFCWGQNNKLSCCINRVPVRWSPTVHLCWEDLHICQNAFVMINQISLQGKDTRKLQVTKREKISKKLQCQKQLGCKRTVADLDTFEA